MAKRHKPEEVVAKLRQIEILVGQGKTVADGAWAIRGWRPRTSGGTRSVTA